MPAAPKADTPDLRQRILATAEELLEAEGVGALSMREVARRAGVTHQAPYHHFADRETILAEIVTRGFDDLARRLARANDRAEAADPRGAMIGSGQAYVGFALEHPGVFRVMFRPDLCDAARFPDALAAGRRAYGELVRFVGLRHGAADAADTLASVYWSLSHGLACLLVDGPLGWGARGTAERRTLMMAALERSADLMAPGGQSPPRTPRRKR